VIGKLALEIGMLDLKIMGYDKILKKKKSNTKLPKIMI